MPGLCLQFDPGNRLFDGDRSFEASQEPLLHLDDYERTILIEDGSVTVGMTSYPAYPVETFEDDSYWVYVEGQLYDQPELEETVDWLAPRLFDHEPGDDELTEWLLGTDGDFIVCAIEKTTGNVAILNDVLGRLPLYYQLADGGLCLGREVQFVLESHPDIRFDSHGIAQYLLFGYPVGDRTLWVNVKRVPPATLLRINRGEGTSFTNLHTFDFDEKAHANRSRPENASKLATLFVDACQRRSGIGGQDVLSLSGGHDSRAIAAVVKSADLPLVGATFVRGRDDTTTDAEIARKVAVELGIKWNLYRLSPLRPDRIDALLQFKNGLNPVGMGFILEFFETLRERYGPNLTYITGDGGDKTLPSLAPSRTPNSLDDLVSYIISTNSVFTLERTAELTGLDESDIVDSVREVVATYPEQRLENRYIHFLFHERGVNWLFEGEDRNRYYFWSVSPFYATPFFRYAMNVPDNQKAHDQLYREFLTALWPRAIEIDNANYGVPISSSRYQIVMYGLDLLERHPRLWNLASTIRRGELGAEYPDTVHSLLADQVQRCDAISQELSEDAIERILSDQHSCDSKQAFRLLTVTSVIDKLRCANGLLEEPMTVPSR